VSRAARAVRRAALGPLVLGLCAVGGAPHAAAGNDGALTFTLENDVFTSSDNNYTNGVGITWVSGPVDAADDGAAGRWARLWSFLPFVADDAYTTYVSWSLAHEMNTPHDIRQPDPDIDDQPYSGIFRVESTLYASRPHWTHAWQLEFGVVGPASRADDVQRAVHRLIGADAPQGWHTQLPNEPVVNLTYTVAHLAARGRAPAMLEWRVVPVATAGVGNHFTGAGVGVYAEVGWNLVDALGMAALRSGLNAASTVGVTPADRWSISFFAGAGAYAVARYLPLDGTLFRDSRSVEAERIIGMDSVGFAVRRSAFMLSFARTRFGQGFAAEREGTDFGTVAVSWIF
jgi:hypothetical protein